MKREIKFRGKPFEKGMGWQYGHLIKQMYYGKEKLYIGYVQNGAINGFELNPETVGQYTRLKDKNGREIYEGDILELAGSTSNLTAEVVYNEEITAFCLKLIGRNAVGTRSLGSWLSLGYECTIIGNAHDNSELMKEGEL